MQKIKKPVSILLTIMMVLGLFTIVPFTAGAVDGVSYIDANGNARTANGVTEVSADTTAFSAGWYAVTSEITNSNRITCSGDVHLILCDGAKLTANSGIAVNEGNSITIYGQTGGSGELEIIGIGDGIIHEGAALGGDDSANSGIITINGGKIIVTAGGDGTAIGGGYNGSGTVIINKGSIIATAGREDTAIGGGCYGSGNVTINGGSITATAGHTGTAIGGGCYGSGNVTINGGTVTATSGERGAAIGGGYIGDGTVTINGGDISAIAETTEYRYYADGRVETYFTGYGAAIGGGSDGSGSVTINGGNITATGRYGAAIGGGSNEGKNPGGTVFINGGNVSAFSRANCASIGGGYYSNNSNIHLNWTRVTDSITADSYSSKVTLENYFHNGTKLLNKGVVSDNGVISGKTLSPYHGVVGHSISLNGDIALNYYLAIPENTALHFEWYNKTYDHTVTAEDFDEASGFYKVKINVAVAEMSCPITVTCTYNGKALATDTYSVRDYADTILDSESDFSKDYIAQNGEANYNLLTDLIKKMLDYGAKAQTRFGVTDFELANAGVDYTMQQITANHIKTKKTDMTKDLDKAGLNYVGTSIVFLSQTTLRHYYVISDARPFEQAKETANFTFVDKGRRICFEKKDIAAAQLDTAQIFRLGDTTYNYSVLDYCKLVIADENKSQADRELAMATYWYNDAAKAYFYANDEYEDDMV